MPLVAAEYPIEPSQNVLEQTLVFVTTEAATPSLISLLELACEAQRPILLVTRAALDRTEQATLKLNAHVAVVVPVVLDDAATAELCAAAGARPVPLRAPMDLADAGTLGRASLLPKELDYSVEALVLAEAPPPIRRESSDWVRLAHEQGTPPRIEGRLEENIWQMARQLAAIERALAQRPVSTRDFEVEREPPLSVEELAEIEARCQRPLPDELVAVALHLGRRFLLPFMHFELRPTARVSNLVQGGCGLEIGMVYEGESRDECWLLLGNRWPGRVWMTHVYDPQFELEPPPSEEDRLSMGALNRSSDVYDWLDGHLRVVLRTHGLAEEEHS